MFSDNDSEKLKLRVTSNKLNAIDHLMLSSMLSHEMQCIMIRALSTDEFFFPKFSNNLLKIF
jgi:hypothetical protein